MTKILSNKSAAIKMPQAKTGDGWVATWKCPVFTDDSGRRLKPPSITVHFASKQFFSRYGLGWVRIKQASIPANDTGGCLGASLGQCTSIGSAAYTSRAFMQSLMETTPGIEEVEGVLAFGKTLRSLDQLESFPLRKLETFDRSDGWQQAVIPHSTYGLLYVPKKVAEFLQLVEEDVPQGLMFTHILIDALSTKHSLMRQLGLHDAIALDEKLIRNSLALEVI